MVWGHATSSDLLHWTEHPVAIAGDGTEDIFSGSVVVDHANTSGFATADAPALVAMHTSAFKAASERLVLSRCETGTAPMAGCCGKSDPPAR